MVDAESLSKNIGVLIGQLEIQKALLVKAKTVIASLISCRDSESIGAAREFLIRLGGHHG